AGPEMVGAKGGVGPRGGIPGTGVPAGALPGGGMPGSGGPGMGLSQGQADRMQNMMGKNPQQSGMGMMMGMQGKMQNRMQGGPGMGTNPMMTGQTGTGGTTVNPATAEESDPNIVEFALYGIISLYDQYTPPAQQGTPSGTTTAPATSPAA